MILYHVICVILLLYRLSIKYHTDQLSFVKHLHHETPIVLFGLNSFTVYGRKQSFIGQERRNKVEVDSSLQDGNTSSVQARQRRNTTKSEENTNLHFSLIKHGSRY